MELKISNDGSHTLYVPELNEHYHSIHGAFNESKHVFIEAGLNGIKKKSIDVFEVGFGTGLNALLSLAYASKNSIHINYKGIELYPVPLDIISQLNYSEQTNSEKDLFQRLHQTEWNQPQKIVPNFTLTKWHADLTKETLNGTYDVVFFDAFAPDKQEEMWTQNIFSKLYSVLKNGGILTTYCAKGLIKRRLKSIGFKVESIPGPPGKREMIRAIKNV